MELHKRTLELSLLSLVGPRAREVVAAAVSQAPLALARRGENANLPGESIDAFPC